VIVAYRLFNFYRKGGMPLIPAIRKAITTASRDLTK
jgi:hypothetical protein